MPEKAEGRRTAVPRLLIRESLVRAQPGEPTTRQWQLARLPHEAPAREASEDPERRGCQATNLCSSRSCGHASPHLASFAWAGSSVWVKALHVLHRYGNVSEPSISA